MLPKSSVLNLPPASNEDTDNHFIRTTYAHLDSTGVDGDGFVEGVERTRARLAQFASGNGMTPRKPRHDLSEAEVKVLRSVDRYV
jgi:USP6 N-terminal-like protein